jgi:lipopolysaccharide export system permease protein
LAVLSGISYWVIIRLLVFKLPAIMVLFFPMAVLFGVMLLFVRMAKDTELTVLRTSGVHPIRIITPVIVFTFLISMSSYITNEFIVPWTNKASDELIQNEINKKPPPIIKENTIFKDGDRFFYVKTVNKENSELSGITILETKDLFPRILVAKTGTFNQGSWILKNGTMQELNENGELQFTNHFEEMVIHMDIKFQEYFKYEKAPSQMNSKELKFRIDMFKQSGLNPTALQVDYYMKLSVPFACLIFGLIGIAYCFSFVKSGRDWWGVIVSICIAVLTVGFYFFITALCKALGKEGTLPPILGAWLPNIAYSIVSLSMILNQCFRR